MAAPAVITAAPAVITAPPAVITASPAGNLSLTGAPAESEPDTNPFLINNCIYQSGRASQLDHSEAVRRLRLRGTLRFCAKPAAKLTALLPTSASNDPEIKRVVARHRIHSDESYAEQLGPASKARPYVERTTSSYSE